jgi:hypothetical protein
MSKQYRLDKHEFELVQLLRNANQDDLKMLYGLLVNESYALATSRTAETKRNIDALEKAMSAFEQGIEEENFEMIKQMFKSYMIMDGLGINESVEELMKEVHNWELVINLAKESVNEDLKTATFYSSVAKATKKIASKKED